MRNAFKRIRLSSPVTPGRAIAASEIQVSEEVRHALSSKHPVVALETAIVSHGLPLPEAVDVPLACERIIRSHRAVPATIGIIEGKIKVGLTREDIERLAHEPVGRPKWKVGRRELAAAMVQRADGGTTVSGTAAIAHRAGIQVFATGGIGGVHRGADRTFDVSSDLCAEFPHHGLPHVDVCRTELGKTPIAVVCAGAKSILDIGLTLEYLETQGVVVATYGEPHDDFPAFYSRRSGFKSGLAYSSPEQVARLIRRSFAIRNLHSGILLGVPIPHEYEAEGEVMQEAVEQAVQEAEKNGMSRRGKEVTPWLLNRVRELTAGRSVRCNSALVQNNAAVAAQVARAHAALVQDGALEIEAKSVPARAKSLQKPISQRTRTDLCVVGSVALDITAQAAHPLSATTSPGTVRLSPGGVARNVAEAAYRLGLDETLLVGGVGADPFSNTLKASMEATGLKTNGLITMPASPTAVCNSVLSATGDLVGGVADMGIAESLDEDAVADMITQNARKVVAFDGNISPTLIRRLLNLCKEKELISFFEPTSDLKSTRVVQALQQHPAWSSFPALKHAVPNSRELVAVYEAASPLFEQRHWFQSIDALRVTTDARRAMDSRLPAALLEQGIPQMALSLLPLIENLWIKLGPLGALFVGVRDVTSITDGDERGGVVVKTGTTDNRLLVRHFKALPLPAESFLSATGAGDSFAAAICVHLARGETDISKIISTAQRVAIATLQSPLAVSPNISSALLGS